MTTTQTLPRHAAQRPRPARFRHLASALTLGVAVALGGGVAVQPATADEGDQVTYDAVGSVRADGVTLFAFSDGSFGYCLDLDKGFVNDGATFTEVAADDYRGDSASWNTDPTVRGKVYWVLAHSYPALPLAETAAVAGMATISERDAITATQFAIWNLTNDNPLSGLSPDAATLANYLATNAVPIPANQPSDGSISIDRDATYANVPGSGVMGPYVVHTDQIAVVNLAVSDGAQVTDAAGNQVTTAKDGDAVYLRTDTLSPVMLTASGTFVYLSGTIRVNQNPQVQEVAVLSPTRAIREAQVTDAPALQEPAATLATTAIDQADGDKVLDAAGGVIEDEIAYTGLVPGTAYTATGKLMDRATGSATGIQAEVVFTPTAADGTVTVSFTVDGSWAGKDLVVFEVLTRGGTVVARHTDLNAVSQTVSVAPTTPVGDPTPTPTLGETPSATTTPVPAAAGSTPRPGVSTRSLPRTGADVFAAGVVGLVLLGAGTTVMLLRRRARGR